jgi:DNA-binding NarL/FixJ family response regulator
MSAKKILIVDDHAIIRRGTELVLKAAFPTCVISEACNGQQALARFREHQPDIVLMDYNMPELNGYDASVSILKEFKQARIILLTMFDTKPIIYNFFKIGGKGFIWKGNPDQEISDGVRVVLNGEYFISSVHEQEIQEWMKSAAIHKVPKLKFSPLELSIVVQLSKGKTSKEISRELCLSPRTIETYRYDLIKKTEVKNSVELIEYAFKNGITM